MNDLSRIILFSLFLILLLLLVSHYYQQNRRTYTPRIQAQLKRIYKQSQDHVSNALLLFHTNAISAFQQISYAAAELDDMRLIATPEDLKLLIGTTLDEEYDQITLLQKQLHDKIKQVAL